MFRTSPFLLEKLRCTQQAKAHNKSNCGKVIAVKGFRFYIQRGHSSQSWFAENIKECTTELKSEGKQVAYIVGMTLRYPIRVLLSFFPGRKER